MNNVVDEILQDEPTYRILDNQGNILYDNISIEMITAITQIGTALNKALFDSIKTDLDSRLPKSYKATQAQAQAGTDNTNYMTALRTKQAIKSFKNIKYNSITLSTSAQTTVNLSDYINDNTIKIEILINVIFASSDGGVDINGTKITKVGKTVTGSSSVPLSNVTQAVNLAITIYPKHHKIDVIGRGNPGVSSETIFNLSYSYETLTTVQIGKMDSRVNANYDEPVSIIEYLN